MGQARYVLENAIPAPFNFNAKSDQVAAIEKNGGKDAILGKGTFRYSPPPGVKAAYH